MSKNMFKSIISWMLGVNFVTRNAVNQLTEVERVADIVLHSSGKSSPLTNQGRGPMPTLKVKMNRISEVYKE